MVPWPLPHLMGGAGEVATWPPGVNIQGGALLSPFRTLASDSEQGLGWRTAYILIMTLDIVSCWVLGTGLVTTKTGTSST